MAFEVVMPRLGWNMEAGSLAEWRKRDGEQVTAGEILFTVESDKAVQEVEALESGILRIPPDSPALGVQVPVGTRLAYLLQPGESFRPSQPAQPLPSLAAATPSAAPSPAPASRSMITARSVPGKPAISPRAARVAVELGVDWTMLTGSGRTGRIVERDVRQAVARSSAPELAVPFSGDKVLPVTPVRRMTAERMSTSAHTVAPVTLTTETDATELVKLRQQLKEDGARWVPSYNDLLAKITASALREHPQLNARFEGETILQSSAVNIGVAVDTERGLLVPVLRDVQIKSLLQIAQESADFIERARGGQIRPDELRGGTFTITNLGMFEIDAFTPIINLPEGAILGIGRVVPKQVVVDVDAERVAIRHMLFLSLTFDHRLVDGAPAARFLQRVKQYVEKPYLWLVAGEAYETS